MASLPWVSGAFAGPGSLGLTGQQLAASPLGSNRFAPYCPVPKARKKLFGRMPDFGAATKLNDWCLEDSPCTRNGALARSWEARSLPLDDIALRNCFAGGQRDPQSETVPVEPRNTHLPPLKGGGGISTPSDLRGSRRVCDPAGEAITMRKQAPTCQRPQRAVKTGDSQQGIAKPQLPPCAGFRVLLPPQMRYLLFAADW